MADAVKHNSYSLRLQRIDKFRDMNRIKYFKILKKLGQGTFGVVQKAENINTGEIVALKQLLNHSAKDGFPITAMREITIMKKLNHRNVLKIIDMIYEEPKVSNAEDSIRERGCFHTVTSYMKSDLVGILLNPSITLKLLEAKCIMQQLLQGIQYIHEQKYLHRDVKAANILIDHNGVVKIADFGLARTYHGSVPTLGNGPGGGERNYTSLVVTRWYRPPEILLGERKYTTAVDMWGVGCVFGELFTRKPIFVGKTDSHQSQIIFQTLGSPSKDWPGVMELPNKTDLNIGLTCKRTFEEVFTPIIQDDDGLDLLRGLLTLNPYARLNALDALNHQFFISDPLPVQPSELKLQECHEIDKSKFKDAVLKPGVVRDKNSSNPVISNPVANTSKRRSVSPRDAAASTIASKKLKTEENKSENISDNSISDKKSSLNDVEISSGKPEPGSSLRNVHSKGIFMPKKKRKT